MKRILIICSLPLFLNCYFWTMSFQKTVLINYDENQYKNVGEITYKLYILKTNFSSIVKSNNRDSARMYLQDKSNWQILGKLNWRIPYDKESHVSQYHCSDVVDYRKYEFSVQDTAIASIVSIEHIVFKNSGLGQITFNVKKDGETVLIAQKGKCELKTEILSKDGILTMENRDPHWKDKIILPIWF